VWFNAIDGVTPDDVWAGGWRKGRENGFVGGQIFLAHWDGSAWTQIPAPVSSGSGSEITGIKAIADDDVWFVGSWIVDSGWAALALHWNGSSLELVETPFPGARQRRRHVARAVCAALGRQRVGSRAGRADAGKPDRVRCAAAARRKPQTMSTPAAAGSPAAKATAR
jgi:hypothetical protein